MEHAPRVKVGDGVIQLPVKRLSTKELLKKLRPLDQEDGDDRQRPRPPSRGDKSERGYELDRHAPPALARLGQGRSGRGCIEQEDSSMARIFKPTYTVKDKAGIRLAKMLNDILTP